ncbi:ATP-binding cassette domain-containing protein [Actinomadura flavalba]|uniref:ATP-binding cassette domain-containing protein n=1 Tax=Actinomadura flavalba TaxID=1120938 RepID=UPI0003717026|nr:ATP-binding cassette domain-containing protein [Actinomadura flavalba]
MDDARADAPVLEADLLGVRTRRGWVFSEVSLRAHRGQLVAVAGPGGSGRTSLLLTLAGRMRPSAGALAVDGDDDPAAVRRRVAVARAGGAAAPEPWLRVRQLVAERLRTAPDASRETFEDACEIVGLSAGPATVVESLPAADTTRLALALALLESPAVIVLDDLDSGAGHAARQSLWDAARHAAAHGPVIVAAAADPGPGDVLVTLGDPA